MNPPVPKISPLERAAQEARDGRLWRAKEILSGYIACVGYSPETFAAYGRVLAQMQDSKEAGKFLFLSGLSKNAEAELVELFLTSVRGKPCGWIFSQFPRAGRKETLADYPENVGLGLRSLGFPNDFRRARSIGLPPRKKGKLNGFVVGFVGVTVIVIMIAGLIHGIGVVGEWIFGK